MYKPSNIFCVEVYNEIDSVKIENTLYNDIQSSPSVWVNNNMIFKYEIFDRNSRFFMLENYDLNSTLLCASIKEGNISNSHHLNSKSNMTSKFSTRIELVVIFYTVIQMKYKWNIISR